jgi:Peptidase family M28
LGTALKIKDAKCQLLEMISPVILLLAAVSAAPFPPQFATQYTQAHLVKIKAPMASSTVPSALRQQQLVHNLIGQIDPLLVEKHLVRLTEFPERYYESKNGALAGQWLFDEVVALNSSASPDVLLTVRMFKHRKWQQPSVIARLEARNGAAKDIVITGTHFDTAGYGTGRPEPIKNPGADDCASGSSVIAETLRVLVKFDQSNSTGMLLKSLACWGLAKSLPTMPSVRWMSSRISILTNLDMSRKEPPQPLAS